MASQPLVAAPAEAAPPPVDDAFNAAFAAAAADESGGGVTAPSEPAPAPAVPVVPAPAAEPAAPGAEPAKPEGEVKEAASPPAAGEEPAPAAAEPAPAAPTADDIVKGLAEALKSQPAAPAAPEAKPAEQVPLYTQEETTAIGEYEKNWPDVAQAERLVRRAEYHDLMKFMFTEVHNFVSPLLEQVRAMGNTLHVAELKGVVPDYSENLEVEVTKWIDTQPAYLRAPYKQVMQQGTSEEVADLIGRYRGAAGTAPAPAAAAPAVAAPAPAAPAPASKTELSQAAKQAVESLAPVSSDRSQIPAGEDPGDFNSAFARYAAAETAPT